MKKLLAVEIQDTPIGSIGTGNGFGGYSPDTFTKETFIDRFSKIISNVLGAMTIAAGIYFILVFMIGAWGWMTAGGNKETLQKAQNRIVYAMIGLALVVAAYGLISIVGTILGLPILNPKEVIEQISP